MERRLVVAWILEYGETDCKEAPFGMLEMFDTLIRIVVVCENSFRIYGALTYTSNYV